MVLVIQAFLWHDYLGSLSITGVPQEKEDSHSTCQAFKELCFFLKSVTPDDSFDFKNIYFRSIVVKQAQNITLSPRHLMKLKPLRFIINTRGFYSKLGIIARDQRGTPSTTSFHLTI